LEEGFYIVDVLNSEKGHDYPDERSFNSNILFARWHLWEILKVAEGASRPYQEAPETAFSLDFDSGQTATLVRSS
tara:strand:+ start:264 stop:488 length:225 start_codon:yes stop_codon:yes gene_type:complete